MSEFTITNPSIGSDQFEFCVNSFGEVEFVNLNGWIFKKDDGHVDLGKLAEAYLKRRAEERRDEYERIFTDE